MPADLANLLCDGDCIVVSEFTPLSPDAAEFKYYAPHIGVFLEVDLTADGPTFYLSAFLERNREEDCARLQAISERRDWDGWVQFFLRAIEDRPAKIWNVFKIFVISTNQPSKKFELERDHSSHTVSPMRFSRTRRSR